MLVPLVAELLDEYHQPLEFAKVTLIKPVQFSNAPRPMLVTPLPIVTLIKPLQPLNANLPMLVTLLGIITLVKLLQP